MRGRKPKPVALRVLEGRKAENTTPQPAPGRPACPRALDKEARREWKRIIPELEKLGLLSRLDRAALAAYCQLFSRWLQCEKIVKVEGPSKILRSAKGGEYVVVNPALSSANKALSLMKSYLSEFGLSPVARTRLSVSPEADDEDTEMERLLTRVK